MWIERWTPVRPSQTSSMPPIEGDHQRAQRYPSRWDDWKPGIQPDPCQHRPCTHPEHNPPGHMVIPQGCVYNHQCPACGKRQTIRPAYYSLCDTPAHAGRRFRQSGLTLAEITG